MQSIPEVSLHSWRRLAKTTQAWLFVLLGGVSWTALAHTAPLEVRLDNGITATIYSPEDILSQMTERQDGVLWFHVDEHLRYQFVTDVTDPIIANKGDGRFHPMSEAVVLDALDSVDFENAGLDFRVFVLPYPRREVLDSSARDGMILLSPGVRRVSDYSVHFTVTHEVGHLFQYRWMPDRDTRTWARYAELRGIEDTNRYNGRTIHRNRPHEIFAEDFRFLFGGTKSTYSESIENYELSHPDEVSGLERFIRSLTATESLASFSARLRSVPNPFNPTTAIQVQFDGEPPAERAVLSVLDVRGRHVRQLYEGRPESRSLRIRWDGRRDGGERVPSGVYFARLEYAGQSQSTKLLLVE